MKRDLEETHLYEKPLPQVVVMSKTFVDGSLSQLESTSKGSVSVLHHKNTHATPGYAFLKLLGQFDL